MADGKPSDQQVAAFREMMAAGEVSVRDFIEMVAAHNHNGLIGSKYVDQGDDWVELALDYDEKLVGDTETGILASGPIISLCDMASGLAISLKSKAFLMTVTVDLRLDYLRPAKVGNRVTARMECYRCTRNIAFVRGQAHDGDPDDPIAHATGSFIFLAPQS